MLHSFDPYHKWFGIPPKDQPPNHYRLLGIELFESDADVISAAAERQMKYLHSLQTGEQEHSQRLLNEVAAARLCLLTREKKAAYDLALKASRNAKDKISRELRAASDADESSTLVTSPDAAVQGSGHGARPAKVRMLYLAGAGTALVVGIVIAVLAIKSGSIESQLNQSPPSAASQLATPLDPTRPDGAAGLAQKPTLPQKPDPEHVTKVAGAKTGRAPSSSPTAEGSTPEAGPALVPAQPDSEGLPSTEIKGPEKSTEPADKSVGSAVSSKAETEMADGSRADSADATKPQPLPDDAAIASAEREMKDKYREEYNKANKPDEKSRLAADLLRQAQISPDATKYVLLCEAKDLAAAAGNWQVSFDAVTLLEKTFVIDGWELKQQLLATAVKQSSADQTVRQTVVDAAAEQMDGAIAAGQFDAAVKLSTTLQAAASKLRDSVLRKETQIRVEEMKKLRKSFQALQENADDPPASLKIGRYLCVVKQDWERGLPLLAKGDDSKLSAVAQADLQAPEDSEARAKLGDQWWDLAASETGPGKIPMQARAGHWYEKAIADVSGPLKAKIEKRLALLDKQILQVKTQGEFARYDRRRFEVGPSDAIWWFSGVGYEFEGVQRIDLAVKIKGPFNRWDDNSFVGIMVDYRTSAGYTHRVAISLGMYFPERHDKSPLWGKALPPDRFVDLSGQNVKRLYLRNWAPAGWDGHTWVTVLIENSKGTSMEGSFIDLR